MKRVDDQKQQNRIAAQAEQLLDPELKDVPEVLASPKSSCFSSNATETLK